MYPSTSRDFDDQVAFEIQLELGKTAINIDQEVYTYTRLLVEIGGISRATYVAGALLAQFAAAQVYKSNLISDLFMVQAESRKPHPKYKGHEKQSRLTRKLSDHLYWQD